MQDMVVKKAFKKFNQGMGFRCTEETKQKVCENY